MNESTVYQIAIVGSGPAGLSAAARAAELKVSHILLEAEDHISDTIVKYQKGKHVMAEPAMLPLRSDMPFAAGTREAILAQWGERLRALNINVRYRARVSGLTRGEDGLFDIRCDDGGVIQSRHVVLGIGLQGNIRRLGVPGETPASVQYTLADPGAIEGETVVVVGAGDAAIENALALGHQNRVILINRSMEFTACKDANLALILQAASDGQIEIRYGAESVQIDSVDLHGMPPFAYVVKTPRGHESIPCHRVLARIGASPPRKLVESFGIVFPSNDRNAVPALSESYESNVPGLYVIGALGGYPLIKQAMNQGYEVVHRILDLPVEPADEPLLRARLADFARDASSQDALDRIQSSVGLFRELTRLQLREFMLESTIVCPAGGQILFRKNDYTNSFFSIVSGSVEVAIEEGGSAERWVTLHAGEYFGEMSLISGRRRTATVRAGAHCVLLETPRRSMLKLISSVAAVRKEIDEAFIRRAITTYLAPMLPESAVTELIQGGVDVRSFAANEVLFREGDAADGLHLIRRGSVTVSRRMGDRDVVLAYVSAGNYVGEMALLNDSARTATVQAAVPTETLILKGGPFKQVLARNEAWREALEGRNMERMRANIGREQSEGSSEMIRFLVGQGLGEATEVLLIDEARCIHCNNCETACAETHDGTSRLNREAGPSFHNIHVPTSCRHCEHPHCMKDCPPDAIRRSPNGEVVITDACIGCGNCQRNCPYGVIQLAVHEPKRQGLGLLGWLAFGLGNGPGQHTVAADAGAPKKAVKCDMCANQAGGAACVRACPTGAAVRVSPEKFFDLVSGL